MQLHTSDIIELPTGDQINFGTKICTAALRLKIVIYRFDCKLTPTTGYTYVQVFDAIVRRRQKQVRPALKLMQCGIGVVPSR